jgi:hypothetical protein
MGLVRACADQRRSSNYWCRLVAVLALRDRKKRSTDKLLTINYNIF